MIPAFLTQTEKKQFMWHVIKEDQIYFDNRKIGKLARFVFSSHFKLVSTDPTRQTTLSHFFAQ